MVGAGKRSRLITIERFTSTRNEFNELVETWSSYMDALAEKKDASDVVRTEILGAEQVGSFLLSHFVILWSPTAKTVSPVDRINYDGHVWNIKGTKETAEGRNRFIEITAVRANNGGG
ncbi:head-tail adaptor protein [Aminobacter niigataensis]|uniref:head-tail adaptor protein n=1 Tax=Aminobacter niigataensis TaxID=83265 RepID=UPI0024C6BD08|nr:head-tail adaptor protein [Aminobacter niigataensis]CAI2936041.1 Bacteriophage head-tail adaptor [Aminobacter niigataensis]